MKKKCISIAGNIASGKSEIARIISKKIGIPVYYTGEEVRAIAKEKHMTMLELNNYIESKTEYDRLIDERTKTFVMNNHEYVLDARLGFYIAPCSFKVFITASREKTAERMFNAAQKRGPVETYANIEEAMKAIEIRENSESNRYKKIYDVDIYDMSNYDFVIDSTNLTSEQVVEKILNEFLKWIEKD